MTPEELLQNPFCLHFEKKIDEEDRMYRKQNLPLPKLDVDLLREHITWAKKTAEVEDDFQLNYDQNNWLMSPSLTREQLDLAQSFMGGAPTKEKFAAENFCGTTGCIAGSIALRFGEPIWSKEPDPVNHAERVFQADEVLVDGETYGISEFATEKLGLTDYESSFMFYGGATLEQIEYVARRACERRGLKY